MNIKIEKYLSEEEIKDIVSDEIRTQIRKLFDTEKNAQRLLSNLSYQIVFDEVDKTIPNCLEVIANNTKKIIGESSSYNVFRDSSYGSPKSLAYQIMEQAVSENKELINTKVKDTIVNTDYSKEIWDKFEELGENFISNIYDIVKLGKKQ
jgi:hypothetical protein